MDSLTALMAVMKRDAGGYLKNLSDCRSNIFLFRLFSVPQGYNKFLVPPAIGGKSKLEVNMSVTVVNILQIDVVGGFFRTRFVLERQWLDSQLSYRNLNADDRLNLISPKEAANIWFPKVNFLNMASSEDSSEFKQNEQYNLERNPGNQFDPIDVTTVDNAYVYSGKENKHFISKEFTTLWLCQFDMKWYPFDTQECKMQFKNLNKNSYFATLNRGNLTNLGPRDLTEYVVKSFMMCDAKFGQYSGIEVRIILGRPLIGNILTVFIPCIILLLICHLVNVFEENYLDMVIGVNLTALLVLATL